MKTILCENSTELAVKTTELIAILVKEKPDSLLYFPAGHTYMETFKCLIKYFALGKVNFEKCRFVGLDE